MSGKLDGELGQNKKLQQELHTRTHATYFTQTLQEKEMPIR